MLVLICSINTALKQVLHVSKPYSYYVENMHGMTILDLSHKKHILCIWIFNPRHQPLLCYSDHVSAQGEQVNIFRYNYIYTIINQQNMNYNHIIWYCCIFIISYVLLDMNRLIGFNYFYVMELSPSWETFQTFVEGGLPLHPEIISGWALP